MTAWFGERTDGRWVAAGATPEQLSAFAAARDSADTDKNADFGRAAIGAGLCASESGYRKLMHETAMVLATRRIAAILSTEDADIVQSIKALDTVIDAYNEMSERLVEWYGIHHPAEKMRPQEIIGRLESSGAADLEALRSYALSARGLIEERKRLETYITGCMEDVAPNLSDVLGPLLGARLIARAGGLGRLARLPAGALQVMGAREALFRHIREGTPSPKHGFIYRHPLVSGSPKRLRGRISRAIAGKAAIAARVDYYSGERRALGDEARDRVRAIKGGKGRAPDER
ncbi:MAG: putative NOP5 family protein [Methanocella sp. PtaU1.Bin125]|nr:MAG: putative NOP5 family protein [Methanocella sp. PtaU1.Bin125]